MSRQTYCISNHGNRELMALFLLCILPTVHCFINPSGILSHIFGEGEDTSDVGGLNGFFSYLTNLHHSMEPGINYDNYMAYLADNSIPDNKRDKYSWRRYRNQFLRIGKRGGRILEKENKQMIYNQLYNDIRSRDESTPNMETSVPVSYSSGEQTPYLEKGGQFDETTPYLDKSGHYKATDDKTPYKQKRGHFLRIGKLPSSAYLRTVLRRMLARNRSSHNTGPRISKSTLIRIG